MQTYAVCTDFKFIFAAMKNGRKTKLSRFIFVFAVIIMLLQPSVIFNSTTIQSLLIPIESGAYAIRKVVKKRRPTATIGNIITREVDKIIIANKFLAFSLLAIKKWMCKLLLGLSLLLSQSILFIRKRGALFEIVPDNHQYLTLSVIRI